MNAQDYRDLKLLAEVEVNEAFAEAVGEWYAPDIRLQVAAAANAMALARPEAIEYLDPQVLERLMEVTHAQA